MTDLEVVLVCGRRPDLLEQTLASFSDRLFRHFQLNDVYANIDPIFGGPKDHAACLDLLRAHFPGVTIFEPEQAGFAAAVQRLWQATTADLVLHLEDDWLLNEDIVPADVLPGLDERTTALALVAKELGWNGRDEFKMGRRKIRLFGIPVARRHFPVFGTSPRFLRGSFARRCAELMDTTLDPEKQMRPPGNPALIDYLQGFRCRFLPPKHGTALITDIGRGWRDARGITKTVTGPKSSWSSAE